MSSLQQELEKIEITDIDMMDISELINDYVVPIELAAKIKGVSTTSIRNAITKGVIRRVDGVTLKSLLSYKVDSGRRLGGKARGLKILKDKLKHLEEKELQDE